MFYFRCASRFICVARNAVTVLKVCSNDTVTYLEVARGGHMTTSDCLGSKVGMEFWGSGEPHQLHIWEHFSSIFSSISGFSCYILDSFWGKKTNCLDVKLGNK